MVSSKPQGSSKPKNDPQERFDPFGVPSAEGGEPVGRSSLGEVYAPRRDSGRSPQIEPKVRDREPLARTERRPFVMDRRQGELPMPRHARRGRWAWLMFLLALAIGGAGTVYYAYFATSGYVAEARFTVRTVGPGSDGSGDTGSSSGGIASASAEVISDSFMVSEYLRSGAAVQDISKVIDLRKMYSSPGIDYLSRLDPKSSQEDLFSYWRKRESVDFDPITGTVVLRIVAYTPADALKLADAALTASGELLNRLTEKVQQDALAFSQQELDKAEARLSKASTNLTAFQNSRGVLDPQTGANNQQTMIATMQATLINTRTQLKTLTSQGMRGPMQKALEASIAAQEAEIANAQKALTQQSGSNNNGTTASKLISDIQPYQIERDFAEKDYQAALDFRQAARRNAERTARYIVTYVSPVLPIQPVEPERLRMIGVVWFVTIIGTGIIVLLTATLREHFV